MCNFNLLNISWIKTSNDSIMMWIWDVAFLDYFLEWLGISQHEKKFLKHTHTHLYVIFLVFLRIHSRLTQTSFLFHLSAGHNAKPISSCISLIRDYVPPSRRGASLAHTHTKHTAPSWQLIPIIALHVAWPASLLRADHMWPAHHAAGGGGKRRTTNTHWSILSKKLSFISNWALDKVSTYNEKQNDWYIVKHTASDESSLNP